MKCSRCRQENPPAAKFCLECGTRLAVECPQCRTRLPATAAVCLACGQPVRPAAVGARPVPRTVAVEPPLEGERKQMTVLFADLKGSLELLADRDPEEAQQLLDPVLACMVEAVEHYEGLVNQVLGDGIMALFGAPLAHEDHAVRACYAALRMQERVTALGDAMQRQHGVPLQIRIGLNSGEVVVRALGPGLHMGYTVVGQTVHVAGRMEQMAKPGSILAAADTLRLAEPYIRTRPLGAVHVKGLEEPLEVAEVVGAGTARSRLDAARARGFTRFVGRERELVRLEAALDRARSGQGQIVALVGDVGVGKSRLVQVFTDTCRAEGALVLESGAGVVRRPGIAMLRRYFELERDDDARAVRERVASRVLALDPGLEDAVPPLLWLLRALREGSPFLALEPAARGRKAVDAIARLVAREAAKRPVVLVFEDLHWLDSETQNALTLLVGSLPPGALLLVNYRLGHDDRWSSIPGYERLALDALPPATVTALLDELLGPDPSLGSVKRMLAERTGGNPLFIEACVQNLAETGALGGERGAYRATRAVAALEVPPTVQAALAARIDRLPPDAKRLLQSAAVIGEEIPVPLLEAIADLPPDDVRRGLATLRAAHILTETALFPVMVLGFTHALARDVAYESLLHDRRRALHARIVGAMERLHGDRLGDHVEALAAHTVRGELWDRAAGDLRRAAAHALSRLAIREATAFLDQALGVLARHPTPRSEATAVDVRCELYSALVPLGDHARISRELEAAAATAERIGDERRLARVLSLLGNHLWNVGQSDASLEAGQRALAIAERTGDFELQVAVNFSMGGAHRALGQYPSAIEFLQRNVTLLEGELTLRTFGLAGLASVLSRGHLVWTLAELGQFEPAIAHAEEAIRIAQAAKHAYSLTHAHLGLGGALLRQGRFGESAVVLERGLALAQDAPALFPPIATDLAVAYARSGRVPRGLVLAAEAVARAERMGRRGRLSLLVAHLGEVAHVAGLDDEARVHAARALALAREHGERGNEVYALKLLAALESSAPRYLEALVLAEELGMAALVARLHLDLGRLARRAGDLTRAVSHLGVALRMLREMDMAFWRERAEAELRELDTRPA
jgi:class 3 adenylate cyclase/tetratricopeptide (TPR) repeat protein